MEQLLDQPESLARAGVPARHQTFTAIGRYRVVVNHAGIVHIYLSDHNTAGHFLAATLAGSIIVHYTPSLLDGHKL